MKNTTVNKVGYMVHLSSERDDSTDLNLKHFVLKSLLKKVKGIEVAEYLSYKSNPLVAKYFINILRKQNIKTIAVQDRSIFKKDIINLFINEGFHFILIEVTTSKRRYRIEEISNDKLKSDLHSIAKSSKAEWEILSNDFKKGLIQSEKISNFTNDIINHFESTTGINISAY
ncbi:hypothetical protein MKX83_23640 [Cytobacillus sp. FSL M8-0252]|uniref:hypothetical protein n=1 Tax=Cytobacillus sp. FSL M8-0252 TaxID=2921621 RepID=UPI0030F606C3